MRDIGTNTIDVKSECLLYDGKTQMFHIANVFIDTPLYAEHGLPHVLPDSVADVILGNIKVIDDAQLWNDSDLEDTPTLPSACPAVTRSANKKLNMSQD